jgi:cytochrome c-type biogenesis protein
VLGFGLVFVGLGFGATVVGGLLRRWSYELTVAAGLRIAAMGFVQMGLLRLAPLMRDLRFRPPAEGGGPASATLIGVAFGFGCAPTRRPLSIAPVAGTRRPASVSTASASADGYDEAG